MRYLRKVNLLGVFLLLIVLVMIPLETTAQSSPEAIVCEQEVIVQSDDWLSKIAEKVYGDVLSYPAIAEATNAISQEDDSFAQIENYDLIEVGWKLCIPSVADAEALLEAELAAPQITTSEVEPATTDAGRLVLATTTSTENSGLLAAILPDFESKYNASVEVVAVGTGQAIRLGENGDADVILVHARSREDAFIDAGYGVNRQDVMYNDFVIIGPADDPASIAGMTDVGAALTQLAASNSPFISRGDDSGTHIKEQSLWQASTAQLEEVKDLEDAEKITYKPEGDWYQSIGQGMGATLTVANEQQAYTLSDRATFLARTLEGLDLVILVEGDSRLFNPYGVIAVNPELHSTINADGSTAFIDWLTSLETQQMISEFGIAEFGQPLFVPDSATWNEAK